MRIKNMKIALSVCLALLACVLMFTACDSGNENQIPSGTTDGTTNSHVHTFGEWITVKESTTEEKGLAQRYCSECNYTESKSLDLHVHSFGEWTITSDPTCDKEGTQTRTCACGEIEEQTLAPQHQMTAEIFETAPTCSTAGVKSTEVCTKCGYRNAEVCGFPTGHRLGSEINWEINGGTVVLECEVCGELKPATDYIWGRSGKDMSYLFTDDYEADVDCFDNVMRAADNYDIILPVRIGTFSVTAVNRKFFFRSRVQSIVLHNSITSVNESAFEGCDQLTFVQMSTSVTKIADSAFKDCSELAYIVYSGTMAEWNAIDKGTDWDAGTGSYTVICSDGNITKS